MKPFYLLLAFFAATFSNPLPQGQAIFGGSDVSPGQFPFFAHLSFNFNDGSSKVCSGSLITEKHILTAAHCCQGAFKDGKAVLGLTDSAKLDVPGVQDGKIVKCTANPKFGANGANGFVHDVAVVELENPLQLTDSVQVVKIPNRDFFVSFNAPVPKASVVGFDASGNSTSLQFARVNFANIFTCEIQYETHNAAIDKDMICLARPNKGISKGDDGGPNVVTWKRVVYQMGVNSFFAADLPSVSARTSQYCDFIRATVGNVFECADFKP
ncbi:hypothetical protein L596_022862 [Steinernema carpocapsae]|uniref:Peptidase S1 domain-containing protein n=1 Tax=Steinernema carpocapsae TaxID=34508 RepID=A0A4U5MBQ0_STECR|nr:hypothetical protein L596_022862 [Steinernema carpocapsae]